MVRHRFVASDEWQVLSYGLDFGIFTWESRGRRIVPILVTTGGVSRRKGTHGTMSKGFGPKRVLPVQLIADPAGEMTASLVCDIFDRLHDPNLQAINANTWNMARVPANANHYRGGTENLRWNNVTDISHAFAFNLDATCEALRQAVGAAQQAQRRRFVL